MEIINAVFDVDGVFTDGGFYYSDSGKVLKRFGPHDGDGVKFLKYLGINVHAITADARGLPITRARMSDMGIDVTLVSEASRLAYFEEHFEAQSTAFVGDGIFDSAILKEVKFGIAPQNATLAAKNCADVVTKRSGGDGAVFEAAFLIGKTYFPKETRKFITLRGLNENDLW